MSFSLVQQFFSSFSVLFCLSICIDLLFGDPRYSWHPVRLLGALCSKAELLYRRLFTSAFFAGLCSFLSVFLITGACCFLILFLLLQIHPMLSCVVSVLLLYALVAIRDLLHHSKNIFNALRCSNSDLTEARQALSWIVGRDTAALPQEKIITACVESVVENAVDGITAPLFWALVFSLFSPFIPLPAIGCAALGMALYKAINTMDSMFGYKNEKYLDFGRIPAQCDDVATFLPARVGGLCIVVASGILTLDIKNSFRVFRRDRYNHASPNSGHTEAATAGALGIQLGGPSFYFGKCVEKPTLGDAFREPEVEDILRANRLVLVASFLFLLTGLLMRTLCFHLFSASFFT